MEHTKKDRIVRLANKVVLRSLSTKEAASYRAKGRLHKMIGKIISTTLGRTGEPKEFFDEVEASFTKELSRAKLEADLDNPDVYPILRAAIAEVASKKA